MHFSFIVFSTITASKLTQTLSQTSLNFSTTLAQCVRLYGTFLGRALPEAKEQKRAPRTSVAERQRYVCRFAQCKCAFSRKYTLQLHERTHLYGQDHYFWKHGKFRWKRKCVGLKKKLIFF